MNNIRLPLNNFSKVKFGTLIIVMIIMILMIFFFGQILITNLSHGFNSEIWFSMFPLWVPLVGIFVLGKKLYSDWRSKSNYLVFEDKGIDICNGNKKVFINWGQINDGGYQMIAHQTTGINAGIWIYIAFKIDVNLNIEVPQNLRKNHLVLTKDDVNNYFGEDKNDLYLLVSLATDDIVNKLNELLKSKNIAVKKYKALINAKNEEHYNNFLADNFIQ